MRHYGIKPHPFRRLSRRDCFVDGVSSRIQQPHRLSIKNDGTVWAWGFFGAVSFTPAQVQNLTGVTAIAAGGDRSMALRNDGTVRAWGTGPLGDGTNVSTNLPVEVQNVNQITAIATGEYHSL